MGGGVEAGEGREVGGVAVAFLSSILVELFGGEERV